MIQPYLANYVILMIKGLFVAVGIGVMVNELCSPKKLINAFMILECVDPSRKEDLAKALDYLANKASMYLGAKVTAKVVLTKDNKEVEL
jgi:hypothetical protein